MPRLFLLLIFLFAFACKDSRETSTAFYYWKTDFRLSAHEKRVLQDNHVKRLYVRFFDLVVRNNEVVPESPIVFTDNPAEMLIVPVIYIKNEVMLHKALDVNDLVAKTIKLLQQIKGRYQLITSGLQIDCDWSERSKENYFSFLQTLQIKYDHPVTATIRLHQIKYPEQTGVPPVEHGVLMYYNMGKIGETPENSIYDRRIANKYLGRAADYPLTLDLALPIFSWAVHIRNKQVVGLIRDIDPRTFFQDARIIQLSAKHYECDSNFFKQGVRFQQGDVIKLELVTREELTDMVTDLSHAFRSNPREVIFYDLDEKNLKQYDHDRNLFQEVSADF